MKTKTDFKVGERVVVYMHHDGLTLDGWKATIENTDTGLLTVVGEDVDGERIFIAKRQILLRVPIAFAASSSWKSGAKEMRDEYVLEWRKVSCNKSHSYCRSITDVDLVVRKTSRATT